MSWLTFIGSNYPWLEHFSMVPKVFEPLKFDCICKTYLKRPEDETVRINYGKTTSRTGPAFSSQARKGRVKTMGQGAAISTKWPVRTVTNPRSYCIMYLPRMPKPASVAQLDARPTGDQKVAGSTPAGSATFFRGDWLWNIFYGQSLRFADSRRAVVSFWRKNVHNTC